MTNQDKDKIQTEIEALKVKETYLEVINSFATILFDAQSIKDIVWSVAKHAIAKLNYYDCVIYLYNEKQKCLVQSAAYGPKNPDKQIIKEAIKIRPGEGIVGTVFSTGVGEIVNDTSKDPRYIVDDAIRFSEITIPLIYKGKTMGVIDSEHPDKNFFNEQDFKLLTTVAAMVSTKLAQAQATEELRKYQFNLEKLVSKKTKQLEETNAELVKKNREKETLLKEIHHRVKNNMQVIISLLNIQADSSETEHEKSVLEEFKNRIRSMALVHDRLYIENDVSNISIDEYIMELASGLLDTFQSEDTLVMDFDIPELKLSIDTAIPLGLIINEILTNSIKHAFPDKSNRQISISTELVKNTLNLKLSDNGVGFDFEKASKNSFGLELIEILINQIGGTVDFKNKNGSHYTIKFEVDPNLLRVER